MALMSLQTSFYQMINTQEDHSIYASYKQQTTYTSIRSILELSATEIGCQHLSPTTSLSRDSRKA